MPLQQFVLTAKNYHHAGAKALMSLDNKIKTIRGFFLFNLRLIETRLFFGARVIRAGPKVHESIGCEFLDCVSADHSFSASKARCCRRIPSSCKRLQVGCDGGAFSKEQIVG